VCVCVCVCICPAINDLISAEEEEEGCVCPVYVCRFAHGDLCVCVGVGVFVCVPRSMT
jgi:hypothetical protein